MKTLSDTEFALCVEIAATGDFDQSGPDGEEKWDLAEVLEERGLFVWVYGPISRQLDEMVPDDPDRGEEIDPAITSHGRLAMLCYQLAREVSSV